MGTEKVAVVVVSSQKGRRCKRKSGRANSEYDDRGTSTATAKNAVPIPLRGSTSSRPETKRKKRKKKTLGIALDAATRREAHERPWVPLTFSGAPWSGSLRIQAANYASYAFRP